MPRRTAGSVAWPGSRPRAWPEAAPDFCCRARRARFVFHPPSMTLLYIVAATLIGGVLSVVIAASMTFAVLGKLVKHLVSLSTGGLLATARLPVLPEAFESQKASPHALFTTLLAGLLFFFLLEKAELYRHAHHHEGDGHEHHHHFDAEQAGRGGFSVLVGDS